MMFKIKYCVASVNTYGSNHAVTFYAYQAGAYGLHRVQSWDDPNVLWYSTESEALRNRINANDCVLGRGFEEVAG